MSRIERILFQGDSITDVHRNREREDSFGQGYACMVAGRLGCRYPQKYKFFNKGISGNRVVDLYARWKIDCWNLKPDVISLLIGVNDVWHEIECQNGVDEQRFEKIYSMLIEDTLECLPGVKFILMEPFVLHGTATDKAWDCFAAEVAKRQNAVKRIAAKYHLPLLLLQEKFDAALQQAPADYWLSDGVHPTAAGHSLIADAWIDFYLADTYDIESADSGMKK